MLWFLIKPFKDISYKKLEPNTNWKLNKKGVIKSLDYNSLKF